jgi:hypothetical protein
MIRNQVHFFHDCSRTKTTVGSPGRFNGALENVLKHFLHTKTTVGSRGRSNGAIEICLKVFLHPKTLVGLWGRFDGAFKIRNEAILQTKYLRLSARGVDPTEL